MRKFILVIAGKNSLGPYLNHAAVMAESAKAALEMADGEYGSSLICCTVYTPEEYEQQTQMLLAAEPDPPWMQVSRN